MATVARSEPGLSHPIGATVAPGGVNFTIFSRTASGLELLLFDEADARRARVIPHRPDYKPHLLLLAVFVPGAPAGQIYGFRANGPFDLGTGFDSFKLLLDPYGPAVVIPENYSRDAASRKGDNRQRL
jgi:glycogen operon protein